MKLLTFSTLFPNAEWPQHGIFVQTSLRQLVASDKVTSRVVAPVPWFPFKHHLFGEYAAFARVPKEETRFGIKVDHPRYPLPPKVGMTLAPWSLASAAKSTIGRILDEGYDFDIIDAHYFYPDGVAAAMLGKYFNKPVVITALGTDINLLPQYRIPRKMIVWAARQAAGIITVSNALKAAIVKLGIEDDRVTTLHNGVDLELFAPIDREEQRKAFGLTQFTLLSVGNLIKMKGHDLVIKALRNLRSASLLVVGRGPERDKLERLAKRLNVADRVKFLGSLPQDELRKYYGAADALVLASSREGCPNVLLESMACGTPVIASNVGGNPEIIRSPQAGLIMPARTHEGITAAVNTLRLHYPEREMTRRYAEQFSWHATTAGQLRLFQRISNNRAETPRRHKALSSAF